MIAVSTRTRDREQGSAMGSCAHDIGGCDPSTGLTEGLALPMLRVFEIFALMTLANDGLNTSSLLRDLLRVDIVGNKGVAWHTSKPRQALYVALGEGCPINWETDK